MFGIEPGFANWRATSGVTGIWPRASVPKADSKAPVETVAGGCLHLTDREMVSVAHLFLVDRCEIWMHSTATNFSTVQAMRAQIPAAVAAIHPPDQRPGLRRAAHSRERSVVGNLWWTYLPIAWDQVGRRRQADGARRSLSASQALQGVNVKVCAGCHRPFRPTRTRRQIAGRGVGF